MTPYFVMFKKEDLFEKRNKLNNLKIGLLTPVLDIDQSGPILEIGIQYFALSPFTKIL